MKKLNLAWLLHASGRQASEAEALSLIDRLYGTALRLTNDPRRAEELVKDAHAQAFPSREGAERGERLKLGLFTRLYALYRRRCGVVCSSPNGDGAPEEAADLSCEAGDGRHLLWALLDADIKAALDGLPIPLREVVWLRDVEGFSYDAVATILAVPRESVVSRVGRGRRLLYGRLTDRADGVGAPVAAGERS